MKLLRYNESIRGHVIAILIHLTLVDENTVDTVNTVENTVNTVENTVKARPPTEESKS